MPKYKFNITVEVPSKEDAQKMTEAIKLLALPKNLKHLRNLTRLLESHNKISDLKNPFPEFFK